MHTKAYPLAFQDPDLYPRELSNQPHSNLRCTCVPDLWRIMHPEVHRNLVSKRCPGGQQILASQGIAHGFRPYPELWGRLSDLLDKLNQPASEGSFPADPSKKMVPTTML